MITKIIKINSEDIDNSKIKVAANILIGGGLVAFPTETVYGLGANALDSNAVNKIFEAKGRPHDDPLIVHISKKEEVYRLSKEVPSFAEKLIDKFWPGPLTIILNKSKIVPKITTGGLDSVAIRMPSQIIALSLIGKANIPVAAPSANLFGKPSPTSYKHVIHDLNGKIDAIVDGGECEIGVESTIVDLTGKYPVLLRPGGVTLEELRKVLGKVKVHSSVSGKKKGRITIKSPGMGYKHYAPKANVILIEGEYKNVKSKINNLILEHKEKGDVVGVITCNKNNGYKADVVKFVGDELNIISKNLFKIFREFDESDVDVIFVEGISNKGLGLAIMNRLRRAAYKIIKY